MGITERICKYIEYKGITKYRFYKETSLSNGFLDKSGNIGSDKCERIIYQYPDLNPDWLLTGRGDMLRDDTKNQISTPPPEQPEILSYLEKQLKEKEKEIGELNQEIGRLKALVTVLEEGGEGFEDVEDASIADVG